jgi:hypothetical protein
VRGRRSGLGGVGRRWRWTSWGGGGGVGGVVVVRLGELVFWTTRVLGGEMQA